ncbi:MAG: hypothetical protein HKM98_06250, partial [Gammaproteobacteria bacterium]|nr:hypothetical protein [Gammaproteobacteria bacterium]
MDSKKRSTLLTLGAIVAGYAALRTIPSLLPEKLELEPLENPTGFRKYVAGNTSGGFEPFAGLGKPEDARLSRARKPLSSVFQT